MELIEKKRLKEQFLAESKRLKCQRWDLSALLGVIDEAPTITPPPNPSLTLEELREMDGEPVWNETMKRWMLVDLLWEFGERTVAHDGKWRPLNDRYYRRKPEEDAQ